MWHWPKLPPLRKPAQHFSPFCTLHKYDLTYGSSYGQVHGGNIYRTYFMRGENNKQQIISFFIFDMRKLEFLDYN